MIKKFVFVLVCLSVFGVKAQNGTVSPYSLFGLGDIRTATTVENQMMGGIGVYTDSIHVNLQNPAFYGGLGLQIGETFGITTYTAGSSHQSIDLQTTEDVQSSSVTNLDYLSVAFALRERLGVGFGILPVTSVGYNIDTSSTNAQGADVTNNFSGIGGLNKVYVAIGYGITKNLSVGISANYNFGTLENSRTQIIEGLQLATFDNRTSRIGGLDLNYSLNYTPKITKNLTLYTNLRVNAQTELESRNEQSIGSVVVDSNSSAFGSEIESLDVNLDASGLKETIVKVPTRTTIGLGIGEEKKWFLGGEYSSQALGNFTNEFLDVENLVYDDASVIAFGGFFVPDYSSFKYLKRITYRAGYRMENTGMIVNGTPIDNFGITFGVGLPLGRSFSNVNLGFEIGKRGTTEAQLVEENYFKINIGLSLNDQWFRKAKIN